MVPRASAAGVQESNFFKSLDSDGDGLLSFQEYMLLITLLSIPEQVHTEHLWNLSMGFARILVVPANPMVSMINRPVALASAAVTLAQAPSAPATSHFGRCCPVTVACRLSVLLTCCVRSISSDNTLLVRSKSLCNIIMPVMRLETLYAAVSVLLHQAPHAAQIGVLPR